MFTTLILETASLASDVCASSYATPAALNTLLSPLQYDSRVPLKTILLQQAFFWFLCGFIHSFFFISTQVLRYL